MLDGDAVAASQQWVYLRQALLQLVLLVAVAVSKEVHSSSSVKGRAGLSETGARRVTRTEFLCFIQTHQIQSTSLHKDFMLLIIVVQDMNGQYEHTCWTNLVLL